jgi:hypothetical protein
MKLPRIKFQREWAVEFWSSTGVLYIKLCRSWDGQFIVDSDHKVLPLFGYRREDRVILQDIKQDRMTTREIRGWRLWMPYLMIWHMTNHRDNVLVTVADDDPRVGTTERVR